MGGSFDPVHLGHVDLALASLHQAELDRIVLVPAGKQPFKLDKKPASGEDRMEMLRIAFSDHPEVSVSSFEIDRTQVSYTYMTLRAIRRTYAEDTQIYFIVGADSLLKISTWMNSEELLTDYSYIVGSRPGYMEEDLLESIEDLRSSYGTEIIRIENSIHDISSTRIREMIAEGSSVTALVGEDVERYIREHGLYR